MTQNRPPRGKSGRQGDQNRQFSGRPAQGGDNRLSLAGRGEQKPERPQGARPPRGEHGRGAVATPPGAVWLYGTHAVGAALKNPQRRFRRLVITEEAQAALAAECPQPWPIQPEITPRDR